MAKAIGSSAKGTVTSSARPIRQSMENMVMATTSGRSRLELSSGIMWASGGSMSSMRSTMVLFIVLLGVFAIGAPGVPGGTVIASLGIVISVLGFDETGTALLLTIFALQDSFGTACNVTGDGALTLILSKLDK